MDLNVEDPEFTELGFRVSRLRLSLKLKNRRRSTDDPMPETGDTSVQMNPAYRVPVSPPSPAYRVPVGPLSDTSVASSSSTDSASSKSSGNSAAKYFRSRLSSASSITSTDSGFFSPSRSRTNSSASSSSRPGDILRRIAKSSERSSSQPADQEFEGFYRPVSRSSSSSANQPSSRSSSSSANHPSSRANQPSSRPSSCSSNPPRNAVSRSKSDRSSRCIPATNIRPRSFSHSTPTTKTRVRSSDSFSDYSEVYSPIEELTDPFEEDTEDSSPPPLPPRKAKLRLPALPPYPSSAVKAVLDLAQSILC